jgi:hypothetical protein
MPNHFKGEFVAKGDTKNITRLKEDLEEHLENYAHNVFPVPEDYEIKDELRAALSSCDVAKQTDYWGSKWGFYDFEGRICKTNANTLSFEFVSAWSMPDKLFKMMAEKYNLSIRVCGYECGCGFTTFLETSADAVSYDLEIVVAEAMKCLVEQAKITIATEHEDWYKKQMALRETYDEDSDGDEDYFWDYWEDYWNLIQKDELWSMYLREINRKTH